MSDLKAAQDMMAAAMAAKPTVDPELGSVTQLLKSLDRASKNLRTFGHQNTVSKKFFDQFYTELINHVERYNALTFIIQREGLFFKDTPVYNSQAGESSENFAFKLYSDGIRELTIQQGIEEDDVLFFFDALWNTSGTAGDEDDDIVTRLWSRNLPTLSIVTADEVMKLSEVDDVLAPQIKALPEGSLREILDEANAKSTKEGKGDQQRKSRFSTSVMGYEVTEEEMAALARDIAEESKRDNILYLLDILTAVLSSERSPELLNKLFNIFEGILRSLFQGGHWHIVEHVLGLLSEGEAIRPDLTDAHKQKLRNILDQLGSQELITLIQQYLNTADKPRTDGLDTVLLMMKPSALPGLCALLGDLQHAAHQGLVANVLVELAKNTPEVVVKHLLDRRPTFVRNLLGIITRWNNPKLAEGVEKILRYPDPLIKREAIRTLAGLKPSGSAAKLIPLLNDADEGVRLATLKPLLNGHYTATFALWEPIVNADNFNDRDPAEKRNIFHAMRVTAGDEAVPYWTTLLTEWGWTNRKKREDLALLAIDALGKLGTPAALAALDTGSKKGTAAVKQACVTAMAGTGRHQRTA
ncbi:MAG TPA: HEAT repeat domain-containing protein [Nitrospira sp.]|jgi:HEAT repeat protein